MRADEDGTLWVCLPPLGHESLLELNYKQITGMIDEEFLQQRIRAGALSGVQFSSIDDENGEMIFMVKSSEHNSPGAKGQNVIYANTVRFKEWEDVVDEDDTSPIERARLLMFDGNLELNCTCPSFLYWGYRWLLTQQGASVFPETRPPVERNPQHRGIVCKHMNRTIKAFPFHSGKLAAHIKKNHHVVPGKDQAADLKSRIADVLRWKDTIDVSYKDIT